MGTADGLGYDAVLCDAVLCDAVPCDSLLSDAPPADSASRRRICARPRTATEYLYQVPSETGHNA
jgi:hypothetical protein